MPLEGELRDSKGLSRSECLRTSIQSPFSRGAKPKQDEQKNQQQHQPSHHTVIFIPGNPGLISYYLTFLRSLHEKLDCSGSSGGRALGESGITIHGFSHLGFSVASDSSSSSLEFASSRSPPPLTSKKTYSLAEQIEHAWKRIFALFPVPSDSGANQSSNQVKPKITLMGHSVGCYIILQILARYQVLIKAESEQKHDLPFRIHACILLFPTVVDIAKSSMGLRVGWTLGLPGVGISFAWFARWAVWALGNAKAEELVGWAMGLNSANRKAHVEEREAVATTVAFLRSPNGVREALFMAADEMRSITADRWDETIWGVASSTTGMPTANTSLEIGKISQQQQATLPTPRLFFYFGRADHWVADHTRDELIAARAYQPDPATTANAKEIDWTRDSRPRMEIDELGTPHGFCIRHSEQIAEKVAGYLRPLL